MLIVVFFTWEQCRSSRESSDPESLETCQGDLLSCIEKPADKESGESQGDALLGVEWLTRALCGAVCAMPRTKAGEVADRSSDVSFTLYMLEETAS